MQLNIARLVLEAVPRTAVLLVLELVPNTVVLLVLELVPNTAVLLGSAAAVVVLMSGTVAEVSPG